LHCDASSITVGWKFHDSAGREEREGGDAAEDEGHWRVRQTQTGTHYALSVRASEAGRVGQWREVYRGTGRGCSVSGLRAHTCYHVRLVVSESGGGDGEQGGGKRHHYIMAHTTPEVEVEVEVEVEAADL
jgi:hypothetical protein